MNDRGARRLRMDGVGPGGLTPRIASDQNDKKTVGVGSESYEDRWLRNLQAERTANLGSSGFLVLSIGLPVILLALSISPEAVTNTIPLALAILVYSSARLAMLIRRGSPRIVAGVFWFFVYITMAVVPLAQAHTGLYTNINDESDLLPAQVVVLVACLSFDIGQFVSGRALSGLQSQVSVINRQYRPVSKSALQLFGMVSVGLTVYYIYTLGGVQPFFLSRHSLTAAFSTAGLRTDGSQVGSALFQTLGSIPVLCVWLCWTSILVRNRHARNVNAILWWIVLFALNIIVNNPVSNARYWFLTVLTGTVFAFPYTTFRRFRIALVGGILGALIVFPYTDYFRADAQYRSAVVFKPVAVTLSTKDYDQWTMSANGIWYGHVLGHTFGRQLLGALAFWVPRSFWPNKPLDTGTLIGRFVVGSGTTNLSSPLWIELWLDFGLVGVAAGFVLIGIVGRFLDVQYVNISRSQGLETFVIQIFLPLVVGYCLILFRGPLLQAMSHLAVILIMSLVLRGRKQQL